MVPVIEEIVLACLVLTGSVQISDNVTLVCVPPTEEVVEEEREPERQEARPYTPPSGRLEPWEYPWDQRRRPGGTR